MLSFIATATLLATTFSSVVSTAPLVSRDGSKPKSQIVSYYGSAEGQKPLADYCTDTDVDIIAIGFVNGFPNQYGHGQYPVANFGDQCGGSWHDSTGKQSSAMFSDCYAIRPGIQKCQELGKKVLISVGGQAPAGEPYSLADDAAGEHFADVLWQIFGPKPNFEVPRPFHDLVVDGFDLDIEEGGDTGYAAMAKKLRTYMDSYKPGMLLTAAPQCVTPDQQLADAIVQARFDHLYIQFYNTPSCSARAGISRMTGLSSSDDIGFNQWQSWVQHNVPTHNWPQLFIGLPGAPGAASPGQYINNDEARLTLQRFHGRPIFGGVMLWDITRASNISEGNFIASIHDTLVDLDGPIASTTSTTTTTIATTTATPSTLTTTLPTSKSTTTTKNVPSTTSSTSCTTTSSTTRATASTGIVTSKATTTTTTSSTNIGGHNTTTNGASSNSAIITTSKPYGLPPYGNSTTSSSSYHNVTRSTSTSSISYTGLTNVTSTASSHTSFTRPTSGTTSVSGTGSTTSSASTTGSVSHWVPWPTVSTTSSKLADPTTTSLRSTWSALPTTSSPKTHAPTTSGSITTWIPWPATPTVYVTTTTTIYTGICPTGFTTLTATITATVTVTDPAHQPTGQGSAWPWGPNGIPAGFCTSAVTCQKGCGQGLVRVTVTVPAPSDGVKTVISTTTTTTPASVKTVGANSGSAWENVLSTSSAATSTVAGVHAAYTPVGSNGNSPVKPFTGGAPIDQAPTTAFSVAVCFVLAVTGLVL